LSSASGELAVLRTQARRSRSVLTHSALCVLDDAHLGPKMRLDELVTGLGIALFMVPLQSISLSGLRNDQMAGAAGLSSFFRVIGGSFGASLAITLWSRREALHRTQLSESISAWDPRDVESLARIAERGAQDQQTYSILERMLNSQSHLLGAIDFFWLTGWVLMGLVVIVWFARPPFGTARMAPAG
jgi:MFS transporter, DHA2 family, multidrug resistance protein